MKKLSTVSALFLTLTMLISVSAAAAGSAPTKPGSSGTGGGSSSSAPSSYSAVYNITSDTVMENESIASTAGDENVVHVYNGANAQLTGMTVSNTGSGSGGDSSSFYGVGSSLFVSDGKMYVSDSTITASGTGNAGVFAYSSGTAYVANTTITTSGSSAGGLHVAGGGTLYAWDCDVTTDSSTASAAIRSDRGGGTMVIDGGSYVSKGGTGAVYVTADITVHNAALSAGTSEAIAMEGRNVLRLFDCDLTGSMTPSAQNDNLVWNVILYQSMSGDSEVGTAQMYMSGGSLTANAGPIFYTTNTSSSFTLEDVDISRADSTTYLLQVTGNSISRGWGTKGSNGASCVFTAYDQALAGDVVYDSISTLNFYLLDGSTLQGAVCKDDSLNGGYSGSRTANVYIDADSVWTVTGDSVITGTLYCAGTIENAVIVDTNGNVLAGSGDYTVTVGAYSETVSTAGANTMPVWSDYAVANPFGSGTIVTPSEDDDNDDEDEGGEDEGVEEETPATPTPAVTPTAAPGSTPSGGGTRPVAGDLNGDSEVNVVDALRLFRFVNGQIDSLDIYNGDLNGDSEVNIIDALLLFRYVNGQIDSIGTEDESASGEPSGEAGGSSSGEMTPPEKPEGDDSSTTPPEKPEGDDSSTTPPEKPEGDDSSTTPPEKPEGDDSSTTPPEKPEGDDSSTTPPEKPEGDDSSTTPDENPGQTGDDSTTPPEIPEESGETPAAAETTGDDTVDSTGSGETGEESDAEPLTEDSIADAEAEIIEA